MNTAHRASDTNQPSAAHATDAATARWTVQRLVHSAESQDWGSFGELVHDDAVFEFVGQATLHGRDEIIEHDRRLHDGRMRHTTDLWTADDTGRVWWRFAVEWDDAETAEQIGTSGASTALVRNGVVESLQSWVDLSFRIPKS